MNLKQVALDSIAAAIGAAVPALAGRCKGGEDDEESITDTPALRVCELGGFAFESTQEQHLIAPDAQTWLMSTVGWFTGDVEIRVYAKSKFQRNDLEESIRQLFLGGVEDQPGLLRATTPQLTIAGVATLATTTIACDLGNEDWHEEFVFSKKRYSFLKASCDWPALLVRTGIPTITQLQLQLALSLDATAAEETTVLT
jgi:hypothetical protein